MEKSKYAPKGITDEQILEAMRPVLKGPTLIEACRKLGYKSHKSLCLRLKRFIKEGKVVRDGRHYRLVLEEGNPLDKMDLTGTSN